MRIPSFKRNFKALCCGQEPRTHKDYFVRAAEAHGIRDGEECPLPCRKPSVTATNVCSVPLFTCILHKYLPSALTFLKSLGSNTQRKYPSINEATSDAGRPALNAG